MSRETVEPVTDAETTNPDHHDGIEVTLQHPSILDGTRTRTVALRPDDARALAADLLEHVDD